MTQRQGSTTTSRSDCAFAKRAEQAREPNKECSDPDCGCHGVIVSNYECPNYATTPTSEPYYQPSTTAQPIFTPKASASREPEPSAVCAECGRFYAEHSRDGIDLPNEAGWKWSESACPVGDFPFHPTKTFRVAARPAVPVGETEEPVQITAVHAIITPVCRANRGIDGALEEAFSRIRKEYAACQNEANQEANFHVLLTVDRKRRAQNP